MDTHKKDEKKKDAGELQKESTFTRDSKERNQDFSNEQNPELEEKKDHKNHSDKSSGNLSDQYHSATETGEIQKKNAEANAKAAQQGDEYYDQGAHQPNLAESEEEEKKKKQKK